MSTRKTKVPAIPEIGRSENEINAALKATKEALEVGYGRRGDPLDRFVTVRDLKDAGLAAASNFRGGVKITAPPGTGDAGAPGAPVVTPGDPDFGDDDYTRPPAPTGISVHHIAPSGLMVTWNPPGYHNHAYTEVFRLPEAGRDPQGAALAPTFEISAGGFDPGKPENADNLHPDFAGRADGTIYTDANLPRLVPDGGDDLDAALEPTTYYYWVRFVSTAGVPGPYAPLNGAAGQLSIDPAEVFGQLLTNITDTQTYADLIGSYFNTDSWNPILQAGGLTNYMSMLDGELHDTIDEQLVRLIGASDNTDGNQTLIQYLNSIKGQADSNSASLSDIQTWQAALNTEVGGSGGFESANVHSYQSMWDYGFEITIDPGLSYASVNAGDRVTMHCASDPLISELDGIECDIYSFEAPGDPPQVTRITLTRADGAKIPAESFSPDAGTVTASIGSGDPGGGFGGFVDFVASVFENVFVSVDPDTAIGQALQAVQASIDDAQTEVQQLTQSVANVDGTLESMWSVKMRQITSSGLVAAAGFGLGLERTQNDDGTFDTISTFLINADQFAVMGAASGAVITSANGSGGSVNVTLQTSAHGIKQGDEVVFSITDTTVQGAQSNPLAALAGKSGTATSVNGSSIKVTLESGSFSGYGSGIGNLKNALMPAPSIPFIVDTQRGVVGIRGKLVVDGLVRAKQGDFDELTAQSAFIQNLQAEVLNANVVIGQRIIAGTPGSGALEPGDYDAISNFIVELNNPVTNDFPMRYWKPATGQTAFSLDRLGNMVVGGDLSVGKNATVRTSGKTMFSLGGAGYDTDYALWIGDADYYGTVGEGRTKANGMLWVSDNGQAGLNVDTFLNSDPLVLPSTTGDIDVRAQRNGQKAAVYGSAMITLLDNLPDSQGHTILGAELWLVPASYQGNARTDHYPAAYRTQSVEYLNSHTHIYDQFSPYTWPTSGSKLMCAMGLDNYNHEQHINLQGGCLAEAGAWKLLVRVWAKDYNNGHHNPYGCASAYFFAQQVHTPAGTAGANLLPPGALDQEQNAFAGPQPTLSNSSDYSIPPMSGHNGDTLFTNGMSMYWGSAAPPIDEGTLVHLAGAETLTGRKTLQAGADFGDSLLPSTDNAVALGSDTKRWLEAYAATFYGDLSGTALEATRLTTARSIGLGGALAGSASFDGTGDITINATIPSLGVANGIAQLDATGKLSASQLPALAITETFVVASESAMLALSAQEGDVAVRTDENKSYILTAAPASTLSNWQDLLTPTSPVTTVFGRTGNITAATGDYTFDQIADTPTTRAGYGITDAQPLDDDLTAIAALSGTGWLKRTGANTWDVGGIAQSDVTGLTASLAGLVPTSRTINGHDLSANLTLSAADVGAATAAQGALADSAVQPGDLGSMASEDDAPNNGTYYARRNNGWSALGSAANFNVGTSGGTVPLLNGANTWSGLQTFSALTQPNIIGANPLFYFTSLNHQWLFQCVDSDGRIRFFYQSGPGTPGEKVSFGKDGIVTCSGLSLPGTTSQYTRGDGSPSTKPAVESTSVQEIIVTSTTPSSSSANSGKLYLVY